MDDIDLESNKIVLKNELWNLIKINSVVRISKYILN